MSGDPPMNHDLPHGHAGEEQFRRALAGHAAGVVVVTAAVGDVPVGLTATSFSSVSLRPPLVSFYIGRSSSTWPWLRKAERFAVNVLSAGQADLAARFARTNGDRFAPPTHWHTDPLGTPLLDGVAVHLTCAPYTSTDIGDHVLVVGLVIGTRIAGAGEPLLYHRGRFGQFIPDGDTR
ncbi:flavin reductase family protein [Nonomuraea sp. CA-218870]|uniref:flavin reductase family protein n=1 Tax=Nonomuraea sp. CA-218870 TaxID=3239998 RepID=UPI003D8C1A26